jgi:hypothetical protein
MINGNVPSLRPLRSFPLMAGMMATWYSHREHRGRRDDKWECTVAAPVALVPVDGWFAGNLVLLF